MSLWECIAARRERSVLRSKRWPPNIGIVLVDSVCARIVAPIGAIGFALSADARGWGLFNNVAAPSWFSFTASLLLLDLAIYFQHRIFHRVPLLWRLHRMHHADLDIDVTTGARFHPLEILLSLGIKFVVIGLLGAPALSVLVFELAFNPISKTSTDSAGAPKSPMTTNLIPSESRISSG